MTKRELLLMRLACALLFIASLTLTLSAGAQIPAFLNPDPTYWYNQYQTEKTRADVLYNSGNTAIKGLQSSLDKANQTITNQNDEIVKQTKRGDTERDRADAAEVALQPCQDENDRLKGKTKVGRLLRRARDGLAVVGGVAVCAVVLIIAL